jgi:transposase
MVVAVAVRMVRPIYYGARAYSPDLNPVEQLFAKLRALLRKAAARTRNDL